LLGVFVALALVVLFFGATTRDHAFVSRENLVNLLRQSSTLAVAAVGMTLVVLTGGIDLSVGSLMALVGVLAALLVRASATEGTVIGAGGGAALLAIGGLLLLGFAWGGATAAFVTRLRIPPLIATLGTMSIGRGLVQWTTGGESVRTAVRTPAWEWLMWPGSGSFAFGIPAPVVVAAVVAALGAFLLRGTVLGTWLYGIGCNEEACRLAGVDVRRVKTIAYGLAGGVFALAGVMHLGLLGYALPAAATGFELDVVTAVVLGGVSITGGEGRLLGVLAAVLILQSLENGMQMLDLQFYEIMVVKGAVLLVAVALDRLLRRRAG
jgi:ribose/xylose/arabinose/galactoside ABC-type transport system permease subunit